MVITAAFINDRNAFPAAESNETQFRPSRPYRLKAFTLKYGYDAIVPVYFSITQTGFSAFMKAKKPLDSFHAGENGIMSAIKSAKPETAEITICFTSRVSINANRYTGAAIKACGLTSTARTYNKTEEVYFLSYSFIADYKSSTISTDSTCPQTAESSLNTGETKKRAAADNAVTSLRKRLPSLYSAENIATSAIKAGSLYKNADPLAEIPKVFESPDIRPRIYIYPGG